MKRDLLILLEEFLQAVDKHNSQKSPLEDDVEPTLSNLIKWLRFEVLNPDP